MWHSEIQTTPIAVALGNVLCTCVLRPSDLFRVWDFVGRVGDLTRGPGFRLQDAGFASDFQCCLQASLKGIQVFWHGARFL